MIVPFSNIATALIGAGASLLGSAISGAFNLGSNNKSFKQSKELMQLQNSMNLENWNRNNAYNSPSEQIKRLRSAGINPDLFYGNGANGIVPAESPSTGLGSAPSPASIHSDFGESTMNGMLMAHQMKLLDSEANKNEAITEQTNAQTPWISQLNASQLNLNESNIKLINESVEKIRSESELIKVNKDIQSRVNDMEKILYNAKVETQLTELGASAEQAKTIIKLFAQRYNLELQNLVSQSYNNYAQGKSAIENASTARYNASVNAYSTAQSLELKKIEVEYNKALSRAHLNESDKRSRIMEMSNQWREDLNAFPIIGRPIANMLDIPASIIGGAVLLGK